METGLTDGGDLVSAVSDPTNSTFLAFPTPFVDPVALQVGTWSRRPRVPGAEVLFIRRRPGMNWPMAQAACSPHSPSPPAHAGAPEDGLQSRRWATAVRDEGLGT